MIPLSSPPANLHNMLSPTMPMERVCVDFTQLCTVPHPVSSYRAPTACQVPLDAGETGDESNMSPALREDRKVRKSLQVR